MPLGGNNKANPENGRIGDLGAEEDGWGTGHVGNPNLMPHAFRTQNSDVPSIWVGPYTQPTVFAREWAGCLG